MKKNKEIQKREKLEKVVEKKKRNKDIKKKIERVVVNAHRPRRL